jgi:hypothetical protein
MAHVDQLVDEHRVHVDLLSSKPERALLIVANPPI